MRLSLISWHEFCELHRCCILTVCSRLWSAIPALWYLSTSFLVVFHYMRWFHHYTRWLNHYILYLVRYMWCLCTPARWPFYSMRCILYHRQRFLLYLRGFPICGLWSTKTSSYRWHFEIPIKLDWWIVLPNEFDHGLYYSGAFFLNLPYYKPSLSTRLINSDSVSFVMFQLTDPTLKNPTLYFINVTLFSSD